jgi:hypothetical protein
VGFFLKASDKPKKLINFGKSAVIAQRPRDFYIALLPD